MTKKKIGLAGWLLASYLILGALAFVACLVIDGEGRFGAFWMLECYAFPTTLAVHFLGLDGLLFGVWPSCLYWTAFFVLLNGMAGYALLGIVSRIWCRNRPGCPD